MARDAAIQQYEAILSNLVGLATLRSKDREPLYIGRLVGTVDMVARQLSKGGVGPERQKELAAVLQEVLDPILRQPDLSTLAETLKVMPERLAAAADEEASS